MSGKKLAIIGIGAFMLAWAVFYFAGDVAPVPPSEKSVTAVDQKDLPLTDSQIARNSLEEVLSGKRKEPNYENYEASARYYNLTTQWISHLVLLDCVDLIETVEKEKRFHSLLDGLYERYGELDHEGALKRLNQDSIKDVDLKRAQISYVIIGWSRVEPQEAWVYFTNLDKDAVFNGNTYRNIARGVFEVWAKQNPEQAYEHLIKAEGEYFHSGSSGYYVGLPQVANFPKEAAQMEVALRKKRHLSGSYMNWNGQEWNTQEVLSAHFASKWAMQDPEAAIAWWIQISSDPEDGKVEMNWKARRLGFLVGLWIGDSIINDPDSALRWLSGNLDILQYGEFQIFVIPTLAKHRPIETLSLIREIESIELQASILEKLVSSPEHKSTTSHGQMPSAIMSPDIVESVLHSFSFDNYQRKRLIDAISGRREFEANKPAPPPSDW